MKYLFTGTLGKQCPVACYVFYFSAIVNNCDKFNKIMITTFFELNIYNWGFSLQNYKSQILSA